jgi:hypothetical protein
MQPKSRKAPVEMSTNIVQGILFFVVVPLIIIVIIITYTMNIGVPQVAQLY